MFGLKLTKRKTAGMSSSWASVLIFAVLQFSSAGAMHQVQHFHKNEAETRVFSGSSVTEASLSLQVRVHSHHECVLCGLFANSIFYTPEADQVLPLLTVQATSNSPDQREVYSLRVRLPQVRAPPFLG